MTIGDKVRKFRLEKGWSQQELAEKVGITQNAIAAIEGGATKRTKWLPQIATALGKKMSEIDSTLVNNGTNVLNDPPPPPLIGAYDLPVYAAAEGGKGAMVLSSEAIDYVGRPAPLTNVRDAYGIIMIGESMLPAFEPGDTLLVHPHLPPIPGVDVILYREDNGLVTVCAKRLRRATADHWLLTQWNPPEDEKQDFAVARSWWPICHRIVGKYSRR
jgi:phage repressor protein C with HTH and peptisase S24 domain